jgi:hypothetical protein
MACWWLDAETFGCVPSDGRALGEACDPDDETWRSDLPCGDGLACIQPSSDPEEGECVSFCVPGSCPAGEECHLELADADEVGLCGPERVLCDVRGGDCGATDACLPLIEGGGECRPSAGLGIGDECDPDQTTWDPLPCEDGLLCVGFSRGRCRAMCHLDEDCDVAEECRIPIYSNIEELGACYPCADFDLDGSCDSDDCDPRDPTVHPGAPEACDSLDNDCDGDVDEGCGCDDLDGDGYCPPEDCDDSRADVHPGATEDCADGADNDCDTRRDRDDGDCGEPDTGPDAEPEPLPEAGADARPGRPWRLESGSSGCGCTTEGSGGRGVDPSRLLTLLFR